ncbi:GntR family transcriptional regulator [Mycobacterium sp. NAZ190054]|uniref:GntR family transcriptional regulator n=1 Tax=Mycobacterium sp. NAZ190054 TaxID=1747766 RepID=UPI000794CD4E|nr:GntR family transcriptional regulator [Mycobacterium sp. NAZ190054]KWX66972.1 GntR family transcriptional regulator [Mycobacterium sp. NAZ190054]
MPDRRHSAALFKAVVSRDGAAALSIVDELRRVILDGAVPPGTPIPVGEVADMFGVSHIPVRESLKTLTGEGLVQHRPNSGYAVAQLTASELAEMYLVRETLESAAMAAAVHKATDADHALLTEVHETLEQALKFDDAQAYHRNSRKFHMALSRPSCMLRLVHMLENAWNITEPVQLMVHVGQRQRALLHEDHRVMLDAFLAGDADALLHAAAAHNKRLNGVVASLPTDTGLVIDGT